MGKKIEKRLMKAATTTMVSLGLLINLPGQGMINAEDQQNSFAENSSQGLDEIQIDQLLKNLTPEQRKSLKELDMQEYPVISPELNLNSSEIVNVIIEFKHSPAKVEVLKQAAKGKKIGLSEAKSNADADHSAFKAEIQKQKNEKKMSKATIINEYRHAFNGVAMEIPANEIQELLKSGVVQRIWKSEVVQLDLPPESKEIQSADLAKVNESLPQIGADKLHQENITGQGIKVGVIDTGVDYNHPDLKDAYKGGYDFVNMDADPMETTYKDWKVSNKPEKSETGSNYYTSHGTHVSGTIVGKKKNNVNYAVEGVAPDADLYVYKVLGPYGTGSFANIIAGIDRAVEDQMDVINLSLGADINDALHPMAVAVNNAMLSGVVTVVAAGNAGSSEGTLGTPGTAALPISVGASDVTQTIQTFAGSVGNEKFSDLRLLGKNFTDRLEELQNTSLSIVDAGIGTPSDFINKDFTGKIALIARGNITFNEKIVNAKKAGAKAVIIYNNEDGTIPSYLGESTNFLPSFTMTKADGERLKGLGPVSFTFGTMGSTTIEGDHLAFFSSRGPVEKNYDIKPDVVAPGVAIFSTVPEYINDPQDGEKYELSYARLNGTSMAAPHVAGSAALLLQAHPEYTPFDVKTALMNTADDLKENYSVNEVGAGRIDVYDAAHAEVSVNVMDKTTHIQDGQTVEIDEQTGSISFGTHYLDGKEIQDSRKVVIQNKTQDQTKSFNIQIEYGQAKGNVQDSDQNGVRIEVPTTLTVSAGQSAEMQPVIHVSPNAKKGRYEGYIHLTNQQNEAETYQVPFSIRISEQGINIFTTMRLAVTNTFDSNFSYNYTHGFIQLYSPLETLDVIVKDAKTGKSIALVGTYNTDGMKVDTLYTIPYLFEGKGYLFTGDPNYPIAEKQKFLPEGDYLLELIGKDDQGKTHKKESIMIIDNTPPKITLDRKPGVYEVTESMYTNEYDYPAVWTHGNITDSTIDLLKSKGVNITQAYNHLNWYEFSPYLNRELVVNDEGNFAFPAGKDRISDYKFLDSRINPIDYALNGRGEQRYWFIEEGSEYGSANYNRDELYLGDQVTMTMSLNNVKQLVSGELQVPYPMNNFKFENAKVNEKFLQYVEQKGAHVQLTDPRVSYGSVYVGVTVDQQDFKIDSDLPFIDVTFSLINDQYYSNEFILGSASSARFNYKTSPGAYLKSLRIFHEKTFQVMPKTSEVNFQMYPEAFLIDGRPNYELDYSKIGAKAYAKTKDGAIYSGTIERFGYTTISGIPASENEVDIYVEVPGHLKSKMTTKLSKNVNGKWVGVLYRTDMDKNYAGELTDDNIVDIRDIQQVVQNYGNQSGIEDINQDGIVDEKDVRKEDINQDGIVDEKDVRLVEKNYLRRGPDSNPNAKAKDTIGKKVLADYLHQIGLEPMN